MYTASANLGRLLRRPTRRDPPRVRAFGHYGVTRSAINGLTRIGQAFSYSSGRRLDPTVPVVVLCGSRELLRLVQRKERGGRNPILAGPNIFTDPDRDLDRIAYSPHIDALLVASDFHAQVFQHRAPALSQKLIPWASGIDETYWAPWGSAERSLILIYIKHKSDVWEAHQKYFNNIDNHHTIYYNSYWPYEYRLLLNRAIVTVVISTHETQGLALAEAWSMDVPTFVYRSAADRSSGAAPYLSSSTGAFWSDIDELGDLLRILPNRQFAPRDWVLQNMTDTVSARRLVDIVQNCVQGTNA